MLSCSQSRLHRQALRSRRLPVASTAEISRPSMTMVAVEKTSPSAVGWTGRPSLRRHLAPRTELPWRAAHPRVGPGAIRQLKALNLAHNVVAWTHEPRQKVGPNEPSSDLESPPSDWLSPGSLQAFPGWTGGRKAQAESRHVQLPSCRGETVLPVSRLGHFLWPSSGIARHLVVVKNQYPAKEVGQAAAVQAGKVNRQVVALGAPA